MTQYTVEPDEDLDLGQDDDAEVIEDTLPMRLSRMSLRELQVEAKKRELSGAGNTTVLISRITNYEDNGGVVPEQDLASNYLKPGVAAAPPEPTFTETPAAGVTDSASAPAAGQPRRKQKTGFFEETNVFRAEFPLGPRGSLDDATHMQFIEETHNAAREAGFRPMGAPYAGHRFGYSQIQVPGQAPMKSVIYEVHARKEE